MKTKSLAKAGIKAGEPHAEVNAVNSVKDKSLLKKATFMCLEPCSHFEKPLCCDLIIKNKIPNVVIGTVDPNVKVAGNGIKLMKGGINVTVGILKTNAMSLINDFTFHEKKKTLHYFKMGRKSGWFYRAKENQKKPVWITNQYSRQLVHKWRTEEQAILVGTDCN
jgi:diaminohydroxyphosphoribosylaminopyrimidine deaminase/5-amino-6-(5-phosphoribosylamino)uracil reductase